jgi:hypothetical protein
MASCTETNKNKNISVENNSTIGSYDKEPLPSDFSYKVLEDESNERLEKNQVTIEINQKINKAQITTLAESIYSSKPQKQRFFIFYLLPGMRIGAGAWAISHFNPDLKIEILGSTIEQDMERNKIALEPEAEVIGKWHEEQYTAANYIIFKKENKTFLRTIFGKDAISEVQLKGKNTKTGTQYDYFEDQHGEYFILNSEGNLEFYNRDGKNFTTAEKF